MRLNEVTLHGWDARVGIDAGATADEAAAVLLLELLAGELGFMLGFTGKAEALAEPATVVIGDHLLVVDGSVRLRAARRDSAHRDLHGAGGGSAPSACGAARPGVHA